MPGYTVGSRRPRVYFYVAAVFLALLGLSFIGFHDVSVPIFDFWATPCLLLLEHKKDTHCEMGWSDAIRKAFVASIE